MERGRLLQSNTQVVDTEWLIVDSQEESVVCLLLGVKGTLCNEDGTRRYFESLRVRQPFNHHCELRGLTAPVSLLAQMCEVEHS